VTLLTKQNDNSPFPIIALLIGSGIWGMIWYPYRLLEQAGISGEASTTITYFFALLLGLILFRRSIRFSLIFNGEAHLLLWIGFFAGWANIAYIVGIVYGEVMRVLLLFYLAPLWTIIFARYLLNERLSLHGYLVIALSLVGAATILWQPESAFPLPSSFGDWMGLLGGFMFALVNVLIRKDQRHNIQLKSIAIWIGITLVGLVCSQFVNASFVFTEISIGSWGILLGVGLMMFLSSVVLQFGLTYTPANQAIVILLFELVVAAITTYFLAKEAMTLLEWVGGLMIISATLFSTKMNRA
jgi:drug/metabolite transporter (DMT)-like permease